MADRPNGPAIPGFGGPLFGPDTPGYDEKRFQYASSSYSEKQAPGGSMRPHMIAYPRRGTDDVAAAIRFAQASNKHIVVRSGGHQYSGMSSGGDDTILLSMDDFVHVDVTVAGAKTYASVEVGIRLTDLANELAKHAITIPHGECPLVAIGGHVQSGGYGHLLRSYGLTLDHVVELKIYTADGVLRTVRRPQSQDKRSLFWGVLGGGPGSFGVLTEVTFECIRDSDHPHSWGYSRFFLYEKKLLAAAMNEIKVWTEKVASGDPGLPRDVDMELSIQSDRYQGKPIFIFEMVNGNKDGRDDNGANRRFLEQTRKNILAGTSWWNRRVFPFKDRAFEGNLPLSHMTNAFVRRDLPNGREFPWPYKKRLNATKRPLDAAFVSGFVDLVDRVTKSKTVKLVVQMFIGGGAYASPEPSPPVNAICHRDMTFATVFDCFYTPDGQRDAERFQAEMQGLLGSFSGDQEVRMLWGSFGDTNLRNENVRRCYYDDETWEALQRLKREVDARDLFHTEFTVQLGDQQDYPVGEIPSEVRRGERAPT